MSFRPGRASVSPSRSSLAITLLVAMLVVVPAKASHGASGDNELDSIRTRLAEANAATARALGEIKSLDSRVFAVGRSIARDQEQTTKLESQIRSAQARIGELEAEMVRVRKSSNARARQMYKGGPASVLAVLFMADTFGDLPRLGLFFESLAEKDGRTFQDSARLRQQISGERTALAATVGQVAARVARSDAEQVALKSTRDQRAGSLLKLKEAVQQAMAAEKAVMAARAAAVKKPVAGPCSPGKPPADQRLAAVLDWYAPASGGAGFLPAKLGGTGVITTGEATWYGPGFDGCRSASGATFRADQMTAASLSLPMGTFLKVTFGGKAVVVVITDRGPYSAGRVLDLSQAAARVVGLSGVGQVTMEILLPAEPAPAFP
ncbi:MAG: septal ring lytic transglycosylase RlpA family protein [Actinomycetota bacterium]